MLPQIIVHKENKSIKKYIDKIIADESVSPELIYTIKPVKAEISIDQIRMIKKEIRTSSGGKRLLVIWALDDSAAEAQNALLKTLEEKQESNIFIFPVKNLSKILPTIQSRSKIVLLDTGIKTKIDDSTIALLELAEKDKTFSFLNLPTALTPTREEALQLLEEMIIYYRERIEKDIKKTPLILKELIRLRGLLQSNNLNVQLTIDHALLFINKVSIY